METVIATSAQWHDSSSWKSPASRGRQWFAKRASMGIERTQTVGLAFCKTVMSCIRLTNDATMMIRHLGATWEVRSRYPRASPRTASGSHLFLPVHALICWSLSSSKRDAQPSLSVLALFSLFCLVLRPFVPSFLLFSSDQLEFYRQVKLLFSPSFVGRGIPMRRAKPHAIIFLTLKASQKKKPNRTHFPCYVTLGIMFE